MPATLSAFATPFQKLVTAHAMVCMHFVDIEMNRLAREPAPIYFNCSTWASRSKKSLVKVLLKE